MTNGYLPGFGPPRNASPTKSSSKVASGAGAESKRGELSSGRRNRNDVFAQSAPRRLGDAERIVSRLGALGPRGATRDELSVALNMPLTTVCGRVRELLDELHPPIVETEVRRVTRTGSTAVVLVLA